MHPDPFDWTDVQVEQRRHTGPVRALRPRPTDSTPLLPAILDGPPPLGPHAPPRDRVLGFLAELAARNIALFSAHEQACAADRYQDPTYRRWHDHLTGLIGQIRPDADAEFLAHTLLGSFGSVLVEQITTHGGVARLRASVHDLALALLP